MPPIIAFRGSCCVAMRRLVLGLTLAVCLAILFVGPVRGDDAFPNKDKAHIVVSQDRQQMLIYEGDQIVRTLPVSTGWPGLRKSSTPAWSGVIGQYWGTFSSFGTTQDNGYWLFTDRLDDGSWNGDILIHGAPYTPGPNGEKVYDEAGIGKAPVSHGCIQLLAQDAEWFHAWDPAGVPITIEPFTQGVHDYPKLAFGAALTGQAHAAVPSVGSIRP
jgi:lipoprotein-anchoring transpeptidase ErfK/SrfK